MRSCRWLFAVCVVLLAACGTPESQCRDGVAKMRKRTDALVGFNQPDDVKKAIEAVSSAETQLATGNYAGCLTSLEEAGGYLRASQRTNTQ